MSCSAYQQPTKFGWIGLGAMGFPMADNLLRKIPTFDTLYIYDIDQRAIDHFMVKSAQESGREDRVVVAKSAREVSEKSDFIITIVPEGSHMRSVYLTPETGLLAAQNLSDKVFVDCSTIDIKTSLEVGSVVHSLQSVNAPLFFDAPVSGGTAGAYKGNLTFMLGAPPDHLLLPILREVLKTMGNTVHTMGGPSLGLAGKLSNNYLSGIIALATSEAMNLGMRLGVDPKRLKECFQTSSGANYVNDTTNPVPGVCPDAVTSRGYEPGFKVQFMKKDMGLAIMAAEEVGAKMVLSEAGLAAYAAASEDPRCRDKDSRVVYRWLGGVEPDVSNIRP